MLAVVKLARHLVCLLVLLAGTAAVPRHVQTSDYWAGWAGTRNVPAAEAGQWLTWAETDPKGALQLDPVGVRTILYTNPNREMPHDPLYGSQEDEYAHTCSGDRARGEAQYKGLVLTDPASPTLAGLWRRMVDAHTAIAHFAAVFDDEADGIADARSAPCGFTMASWLREENALIRGLGYPVIYNGLRYYDGHGISQTIALNQSAIGGMEEECYSELGHEPRVGGWPWHATEQTEIAMARADRYFFCYGRDLTPADQAYAGRLYTYASFLLTYDPRTSVLWEYYKTPSGGHVMPESQLVAWNPVRARVDSVDVLRTAGGAYVRRYRACYLDGRAVGPCAAAVNPDDVAHPLDLQGYRHTLVLHGSGVFDGGSVSVNGPAPGTSIAPLEGVIAFER